MLKSFTWCTRFYRNFIKDINKNLPSFVDFFDKSLLEIKEKKIN